MARDRWEEQARKKGFQRIAGVDEAGRGPLAGPVVAAACVFSEGVYVEGVDDSKSLSPAKRFKLYETLIHHPDIDYAVGIIEPPIIDEINILQATFQAMVIAIASLKQRPDYVLVDGPYTPTFGTPDTPIPAEGIIDGDSLVFSISAASIIAKETRDRIMRDHHLAWPQYGFHRHKGYGTAQHLAALALHGPCPIHRRSFRWKQPNHS